MIDARKIKQQNKQAIKTLLQDAQNVLVILEMMHETACKMNIKNKKYILSLINEAAKNVEMIDGII